MHNFIDSSCQICKEIRSYYPHITDKESEVRVEVHWRKEAWQELQMRMKICVWFHNPCYFHCAGLGMITIYPQELKLRVAVEHKCKDRLEGIGIARCCISPSPIFQPHFSHSWLHSQTSYCHKSLASLDQGRKSLRIFIPFSECSLERSYTPQTETWHWVTMLYLPLPLVFCC